MKVRICCRFPLRTSAIAHLLPRRPCGRTSVRGPSKIAGRRASKQTSVRARVPRTVGCRHPPWSLERLCHTALGGPCCEQVFGKAVDSEHLFVLQCQRSEQVFEEGAAMSVALELEYEAFYPRLRVVSEPPDGIPARRRPAPPLVPGSGRWRPARAADAARPGARGQTVAGTAPAPGQEYVVQSGDTLASIAAPGGAGQRGGAWCGGWPRRPVPRRSCLGSIC